MLSERNLWNLCSGNIQYRTFSRSSWFPARLFLIHVRWHAVNDRHRLGATRGLRACNELFPKLNVASFTHNYSLHLSRRRRHFAHLLRSGESATSLTSYSLPADPRPIPAKRSVFPIRKLAEPTGNTCRTPEIGFRFGIINRSRIKNNLAVNGLLCIGEQLVLRRSIYVALL